VQGQRDAGQRRQPPRHDRVEALGRLAEVSHVLGAPLLQQLDT
jgi:hypothetical protein